MEIPQNHRPEFERESQKPKLEDIYRILSANNSGELLCDKKDNELLFCSEFNEERQAMDAEIKLKNLGLEPRRDGKKIFLTFLSSLEEIEALQKISDFKFQEL